MNFQFREEEQRLIEAVLTQSGDTESDLRRSIKARAAHHAGCPKEDVDEVPSELQDYVDKVSKHAYKVTDEDVEALKKEGYSEDAIFEITLSIALGAGVGRIEQGIRALRRQNETKKS